ncbi:uncharacterized protein F4812DRAFT_69659 [Daldinia caldariorum]|uniref:uncharacterized protein n=1 Tax=Daldinia caldariorum TaxID=326644 RepID=UPI0020084C5C|nr:uncharacterized protein F4812DRAFT_69659 [Daldinia caldariorum]KAI1466885.1 hypothetical protein F4812DRAFT_69659 [Daldinia caldariorum]
METATFLIFCLALLARNVQAQDSSNSDNNGGSGSGRGWSWAGYPGADGGAFGGNPYNSGSAGGGLSVFANFDIDTAVRYRTAHGIIAAICFVVIFPCGAIIVRLLPSRHTWLVHAVVQCVGFLAYVAAAALAIRLIQMVRIPPDGSSLLEISSTNAHPIIGIILLVLMFLQPALGFVHHAKFKRLRRRTFFSHAHLWLGRTAITLGIINGGLGLKLANASQDLVIAYSVVAAFVWLVWLIAAVFGEMRRRRGDGNNINDRNKNNSPSSNEYMAPNHTSMRFNRDGRRRSISLSLDPSPPYTPGPIYGGPPVDGRGQTVEMMPARNVAGRQRSISPLSSELTPVDGRRRSSQER